MKRRVVARWLLIAAPVLSAVLTLLGVCGFLSVSAAQAAATATPVSGAITADTVWTPDGSPYLLSGAVTVLPTVTLTVEPGVTVKGESDAVMSVQGHLQAVGSASNPITFTSELDSAPAQWAGLFMTGTAQISHATIRYGAPNLYVTGSESGAISLQHVTFAGGNAHTLRVDVQALHRVQMENLRFEGNDLNRVLIGGPYEPIALVDNVTLAPHTGLEGYELPPSSLIVTGGLTLTVEPGVTLMARCGGCGAIGVNEGAYLEAIGTPISPITFTSAADSAPGEWTGIVVHGSAHLKETVFRNGVLNVDVQGSGSGSVLIENSVMRDSNAYGLAVAPESLHRLWMKDVAFVDNAADRVVVYSLDREPGAADEITMVDDATLSAQPGLEGYEYIDGKFSSSEPTYRFTIPEGITLTLEPGVTWFSPPTTELRVKGGLRAIGTESAPITFTSPPTRGLAWSGIRLMSGTLNLAYARVTSGISSGLYVEHGRTTLYCSTIAHNEGYGVSVTSGGTPSLRIHGTTIVDNDHDGLYNGNTAIVDARYNWWGDPSGPAGDGPGSGAAVHGNVLYEPWLPRAGCQAADLAVDKWASASVVLQREPLTYTLAITNKAPFTVTGVTVTDTLPAGATLIEKPTICSGQPEMICSLGALAPRATAMLIYTVAVSGLSGAMTNTVKVSAAEAETYPADNAASVTTTVAPRPRVAFRSADYHVIESAGQASITVTVDITPAMPLTVAYHTENGTASPGVDYISSTGTLVFTAARREQTFVLPLIDDLLPEALETVALSLEVLAGGDPAFPTMPSCSLQMTTTTSFTCLWRHDPDRETRSPCGAGGRAKWVMRAPDLKQAHSRRPNRARRYRSHPPSPRCAAKRPDLARTAGRSYSSLLAAPAAVPPQRAPATRPLRCLQAGGPA